MQKIMVLSGKTIKKVEKVKKLVKKEKIKH